MGSTEPLTPSESDLRCMRHNVGQKGLSTKGRITMQQKYITLFRIIMLVISVKFHENRTKTVEILRGSKLDTRTSVPRADNPEIKKNVTHYYSSC